MEHFDASVADNSTHITVSHTSQMKNEFVEYIIIVISVLLLLGALATALLGILENYSNILYISSRMRNCFNKKKDENLLQNEEQKKAKEEDVEISSIYQINENADERFSIKRKESRKKSIFDPDYDEFNDANNIIPIEHSD